MNFNPRSRKGSDEADYDEDEEEEISIHAPARGATGKRVACLVDISISIHAPARGATRKRMF